MIIPALTIDQDGPGIDLSEQPEGYLLNVSDPVADFEYARNAVTFNCDLSGVEHVRLLFKALEYGDEPHAPPAAPFGSDANFDGVAVSADGADWYEIQDLRHLRSDKYTSYDLDLDALVSGLGLTYNDAFRIRFCQYDDNPAPMDGFTIEGIRIEGDALPPYLLLPMNDDAATPTVVDTGTGLHDQTFVDPTGDPNTNAHTAPGKVGTALSFDGVDDRIVLTDDSYKAFLEEDHDFAIAYWWKTNAADPAQTLYFMTIRDDSVNSFYSFTSNGNVSLYLRFNTGTIRYVSANWTGGADDAWHHYILMRNGTVLSIYRDGVLAKTDDNPENTLSLAPPTRSLSVGATQSGGNASPGYVDDFRVYDRALLAPEIAILAGIG